MTYVSVLGPHNHTAPPKLMAFTATIVLASKDYQGLAWARYDTSFWRQAALMGNRS